MSVCISIYYIYICYESSLNYVFLTEFNKGRGSQYDFIFLTIVISELSTKWSNFDDSFVIYLFILLLYAQLHALVDLMVKAFSASRSIGRCREMMT